jgi:hypothetical protein
MDHSHAKARAFARLFGGEERLEHILHAVDVSHLTAGIQSS